MHHTPALALAIVAVIATHLPAQSAAPQGSPERGPDHTQHTTVPGIEVPTVPGAPFTGTDTILRTRTVDGGGSVVTATVARVVRVVRDSQGRVYRERHHFAPLNTDP